MTDRAEIIKRRKTRQDDPDETVGRLLYRAIADRDVRMEIAMARHKVTLLPQSEAALLRATDGAP